MPSIRRDIMPDMIVKVTPKGMEYCDSESISDSNRNILKKAIERKITLGYIFDHPKEFGNPYENYGIAYLKDKGFIILLGKPDAHWYGLWYDSNGKKHIKVMRSK